MTRPLFGVVGGGTWGLSLAKAARRSGQCPVLLTRRQEPGEKDGLLLTQDVRTLCEARVILLAVPSHRVRDIARTLGEHLDGGHFLVHGVRGLCGERLQTISEILREETPVRRLGALGGPVQPDELSEGRPSAMVVASRFDEVRDAVSANLSSPKLKIQQTADLIGLEWASALMGAVSIGVGFAQARDDVSPGLLAALISSAVDEAAAIASSAGADRQTFYGLGGYGDLLASIGMPDRPEVVLGRELAHGASLADAQKAAALRIEAVELIPRVVAFASQQGVKHKRFAALGGLLGGTVKDDELLKQFL